MHTVSLTITNLVRTSQEVVKYRKYSNLTFKTSDGALHWWYVEGWPQIYEGMAVTALLSDPMRPNRSNRVLAWICHDTGEEAYYSHSPVSHLGAVAVIATGYLCLKINAEIPSLVTLISGIVFLLAGILFIGDVVRQRVIVAKLRSIKDQLLH